MKIMLDYKQSEMRASAAESVVLLNVNIVNKDTRFGFVNKLKIQFDSGFLRWILIHFLNLIVTHSSF